MNLDNARKIHCIGIGGIGVSAIAKLFVAQGKEVTGSDSSESIITKSLKNIKVVIGHDIENVKGVDLVVYSDAIPNDNIERIEARNLGIPEISYAQALGEISKEYKTIVVTGTHGKSTTSAMLGLILEKAGMDPLVITGTMVPGWEHGNLRLSNEKEFLIVEGDDYRDHFLQLNPYAVVVTNIEFDHPDFFKDIGDTLESFKELIEKVPEDGFVFLNKDDKGCEKLNLERSVIKYDKVDFKLNIPGEFNQYNAGGAAACAYKLGVDATVIKSALMEFNGVWRRFEIVGEYKGATIISDYGHHPTAIKQTMKAVKEAYPDKRSVLIYEPHQHSRTKRLFNDFVSVLKDCADILILSEIYHVKGRMEDRDVSSKEIADKVGAIYGSNIEETEKVARDIIEKGDIVVVMGAGDIDQIARNLTK